MAYIKLSPNLFIGSMELKQFQKMLSDSGFKKLFLANAASFGLFTTPNSASNGLVSQGTNIGTIKHNEILAVNSAGNLIVKAAADNIAVSNDNQWYWVRIKHQFTAIETGTVSVDAQGNLTGLGTKFLEVLRGNPLTPARIKFTNSVSNNFEYNVHEVLSDSSALLLGDFIAESGLSYAVVGSFSPEAVPIEEHKYIFQYDGCEFSLILETALDTPPAVADAFFLARIRRNGSSLEIQDKRLQNIYRDKSDYALNSIALPTNPVIGVEAIKYNNSLTPKEENLAFVSWTFRSQNWTIDPSLNRVTFLSGVGGKYKSTANVVNGDFDGWRLYTKDGAYTVVQASSVTGNQVNLTLTSMDASKFSDVTQMLILAPDVEEIELIFTPNPADANDMSVKRVTYPINMPYAIVPLVVFKSSDCRYNLKYRYKNHKTYTAEAIPFEDTVGFLNENSFNSSGVQIASTYVPYVPHLTNGYILLTLAPDAYANRLGNVETGDKYGIEYLVLDNANPVVTVRVAEKTLYQYLKLSSGFSYTLGVNHYIDLRTDSTIIRQGNRFIFRFVPGTQYVPGSFSIFFVQNYVNSGTPGTQLYKMTASDFANTYNGDFKLEFIFDGTNWIVRDERNTASFDGIVRAGDLNDFSDKGSFFVSNADSVLNKPTATNGYLIVNKFLDVNGDVYCTQTYHDMDSENIYTRRLYPEGNWRAWQKLLLASEADAKYATKVQSGWVDVPLINGWAISNSRPLQYRIDQLGQIHLRGQLNGAAASSSVITANNALPAPTYLLGAQAVEFPIVYFDSGTPVSNSVDVAFASINNVGRLAISSAAFTNDAPRIELDGHSYWTS